MGWTRLPGRPCSFLNRNSLDSLAYALDYKIKERQGCKKRCIPVPSRATGGADLLRIRPPDPEVAFSAELDELTRLLAVFVLVEWLTEVVVASWLLFLLNLLEVVRFVVSPLAIVVQCRPLLTLPRLFDEEGFISTITTLSHLNQQSRVGISISCLLTQCELVDGLGKSNCRFGHGSAFFLCPITTSDD